MRHIEKEMHLLVGIKQILEAREFRTYNLLQQLNQQTKI